jgi:ABC-type antimicrobial peptide transport system permease subunit
MGAFFPFFRIDSTTSIAAIGLSLGLGIISGILPAYQVSKLEVVASLRKVG